MKLNIQYKTVSELEPYDNNPRSHSMEQIRQIANSIKEFGFTNPILLDGENGVIAGHGMLYASRLLELDKVPCIELSHLTEQQKRAYVIADNQIALNSDWDFEILKEELDKLDDSDFDLKLTGVNIDDVMNIDIDGKSNETSSKNDSSNEGRKDDLFRVIVICEDESDRQAVLKLIRSKGYECK